jgi:hypothetical protein
VKTRPLYCEALDEDKFPDAPCPACGATVAGNDPVRGVCQARRGPPPTDYGLRIVLTHRDTGQII